MGGVSDSVQRARDAIARSNLRRSGLDRTIGGASSQANYGRASRGQVLMVKVCQVIQKVCVKQE